MDGRLGTLLGALGSPRVFVLGDLILDRYLWGAVERVSPEAPVLVLRARREECRPGGAANVARNLAALGAAVSCGGVVGRDGEGRDLLRGLAEAGVGTRAVLVAPSRPTPLKTRMMAQNQHLLRVDREDTSPIGPRLQRRLLAASLRAAARADLVVLSDYSKGTLPAALCRRVIRGARRPVLAGVKGRDFRKFSGALGGSLNRAELAALAGDDDADRGARRLLRLLGLGFLVVTMGEAGMRVYPRGRAPVAVAAAARQVYDVTGAGDTALAAFAVAHASGLPLGDCAEVANAAAGIVVSKVGAETVTVAEMAAWASGRGAAGGGP